ncbi:MAG: prepilin-type N-terminal cleavage/methylation domain-containing protein [Pseudomonadota bacterium]
MQTSCGKPRATGFTLIELMVVVLLIGLGLGVSLTLDFSSSPQRLEQQTRQVANITELLAQEAVLSGAIMGLDFFIAPDNGRQTAGMRWLRQDGELWVPADIGETGEQGEILFASEMELQLEVDGNALIPEEKRDLEIIAAAEDEVVTFSPELLFLPSREITPFVLSLSTEDDLVSNISADIMGRVRVNEDAPTPP